MEGWVVLIKLIYCGGNPYPTYSKDFICGWKLSCSFIFEYVSQ